MSIQESKRSNIRENTDEIFVRDIFAFCVDVELTSRTKILTPEAVGVADRTTLGY